MRFQIAPGMASEAAQQRAQIFAAAFAEITQQRVKFFGRQRRGRGEPRIVAVLAGQHGERDAALARQRGEPLDAVFPPIEAAEEPHHDHLGVRADTIDPQVDRHRMAKLAQVREPHARQRRAFRLPSRGEPGEIAVGEGEHDDVAGRLAEIDRFDDLVEIGRSGREQNASLSPRRASPLPGTGAAFSGSCAYPISARVTAVRSSPFSPITTSRPSRASEAAQGRS